jgi:hypothetical protein
MDGLGLRAGDWVEVKGAAEILATLDEHGCLDGLPFMPEMLQYAGRRFEVYKSAHKTCDTIDDYTIRRMAGAVHLKELRCDGEGHGGCQAGCLLFWKEAWLRRLRNPDHPRDPPAPTAGNGPVGGAGRCDLETLSRATRGPDEGEPTYRCQATQLLEATSPGFWWDPRPYLRDLTSRNVRFRDLVRYVALAAFNLLMRFLRRLHWRLRPYVRPYPHVSGLATERPPEEALELKAGDLVRVRPQAEIMRTLNEQHRHRGLWFDVEMVPHCGKTARVLRRVERLIDEKTGRMRVLRNPCLILEGVACSGFLSTNRLFCPRSIYPYWREVWLERGGESGKGSEPPPAPAPG